jgi:hypothetical protein
VTDERTAPAIREDGGMPGSIGVTVDAADGPRREPALTLINSGDASVRLADVEITRNVG